MEQLFSEFAGALLCGLPASRVSPAQASILEPRRLTNGMLLAIRPGRRVLQRGAFGAE